MSMLPELTALDRRVLEAVRRPAQPYTIARRLTPEHERMFLQDRAQEVRLVLSGLEHLGYVRRRPGGYWEAVDR